jgi:GDP-4-dehydro-6-deoxy-D-mannose reductase
MAHRIAVTGVNGFVGRHTARDLHAAGHWVVGIGRNPEANTELRDILDEYVSADLSLSWPATPDVDSVIHLAGLAVVGASFARPQEYLNTNSSIVTNMCESLLAQAHPPRVVGVSSGAVYAHNQPQPLDESAALDASSPYVVSKLLVENQLDYYSHRGLECVVARPFNHLGPGQESGFLAPDLLAAIRRADEQSAPMLVGDLSTQRDYTDVRDVATAYRLIATAPRLGHPLYNVCSGNAVSGEDLLALIAGTLRVEVPEARIDESRLRPSDAHSVVGDSTRLRAELEWRPRFTLQRALQDMVEAAPIGPSIGHL